jgi:methyl-accepting chemotaxis protein
MKTLFTSLRAKMIIILLLLLLIPSLVVGLVGYQVSKAQLNKSGEIQLKNDVRLLNSTIGVLNNEVQSGKISLEQAQEQVKEEILGSKVDGKRPINHQFNLGKYGYFFILDNHAVEVAHPTLEGKSIWNVTSADGKKVGQDLVRIGDNGGGFYTYDWPLPNSKQIATKITYVEEAPAWGWVVCAGSYMSDFNSGASQVLIVLGTTLAVALILGLLVALTFSQKIAGPLKAITGQIKQVADGKLNVTPLHLKRNDEIGQLATHFYKMTDELKEAILSLTDTSSQVAASAEELTASSGESSKATEHITDTIQKSASDTEQQATHLGESKESIERMAGGIVNISSSAGEAATSALEAAKVSDEGSVSIERAVAQMTTIHETVNETADVVQRLAARSIEISQIVDVIKNIAGQTNLLALNAAIEAARAGTAGQSFAVVAGEVRKLAEQSGGFAKQISDLIESIKGETEQAVLKMHTSTESVQDGLVAVNLAGDSFKTIKNSINSVATRVQEVSESIHKLSSYAKGLQDEVITIAEMSGATSENMQTVSAVTEEQLASIQEIAASAASLSELAESLNQLIGRFQL